VLDLAAGPGRGVICERPWGRQAAILSPPVRSLEHTCSSGGPRRHAALGLLTNARPTGRCAFLDSSGHSPPPDCRPKLVAHPLDRRGMHRSGTGRFRPMTMWMDCSPTSSAAGFVVRIRTIDPKPPAARGAAGVACNGLVRVSGRLPGTGVSPRSRPDRNDRPRTWRALWTKRVPIICADDRRSARSDPAGAACD
jgi:hypothetical protein